MTTPWIKVRYRCCPPGGRLCPVPYAIPLRDGQSAGPAPCSEGQEHGCFHTGALVRWATSNSGIRPIWVRLQDGPSRPTDRSDRDGNKSTSRLARAVGAAAWTQTPHYSYGPGPFSLQSRREGPRPHATSKERKESGCPQSLQRVSGCQGWRTTGSEASAFRVSWSRNSLRTMASETNWSNHSADAT